MATTKRGTKSGAKARPARPGGAKKGSAKKTGAKRAKTKKVSAAKARTKKSGATKAAVTKPRAKKPAVKKASVRKPAGHAAADLAAAALTKKLKAQFARERGALERRLTETVREIGLLRHHEMRAMQFERQLAERDATIADLRRELEVQQRTPSPPPPDTQTGLNFGGGTLGIDDLDETAAAEDEDDDLL